MMKLKYKGFVGSINQKSEGENHYGYSEYEYYYGKIENIKDLVTYEGQNLEELEKHFKESVDDYIEHKYF